MVASSENKHSDSEQSQRLALCSPHNDFGHLKLWRNHSTKAYNSSMSRNSCSKELSFMYTLNFPQQISRASFSRKEYSSICWLYDNTTLTVKVWLSVQYTNPLNSKTGYLHILWKKTAQNFWYQLRFAKNICSLFVDVYEEIRDCPFDT